jgi:hypothetical protein
MARKDVRVLVVTNDWEGAINGGFIRWNEQPSPDNTNDILGARFQLGEFIKVLQETEWSPGPIAPSPIPPQTRRG